MSRSVKAVYHNGVFVTREFCDLPEGSEVELIIQGPALLPPEVKGSEEKETILRITVERMQQNPIPSRVPRLTREALHERH
jgi:predicted DNA-binding antitoxin AbrB/MazE fold protein